MAYSSIAKPTDYFNTILYTGNGSVTTQTGVGFQPDFVWIKERNGTNNHEINDAVRGANYQIYPNLTNAQTNAGGHLTAFASDGFTLGTDGAVNTNTNTYVSWNWKANGAGSSNSDGSITSTVSANTTAGFSIVKVAKSNTNVATIGHGLGVAPKFIIGKDLDTADNWTCYHASIGNGKGLYLNATNAEVSASTFWNSTSPTSSVFTIGSDNTWNSPSIVFYCFADVKGYAKIGSYKGGTLPFIYLGFKPAVFIVKEASATNGYNWIILDNKRNGNNNPIANRLQPSSSATEYTDISDVCDFNSNGLKWRNQANNWANTDGRTYIYIALAESPFVANDSGTAVPTTAR